MMITENASPNVVRGVSSSLHIRNFLERLPSERSRRAVIMATVEDIPLSRDSGLAAIQNRIWHGNALQITWDSLLIWFRIALNVFTAFDNLMHAATRGIYKQVGSDTWRITDEELEICSDRLHGIGRCLSAHSLPSILWRILLITEATCILVTVLLAVSHSLHLLTQRNGKDKSAAANGWYLSVALPRLGGKCSLLTLLHLVARISQVVMRGDASLVNHLFWKSLRRCFKEMTRSAHDGIHTVYRGKHVHIGNSVDNLQEMGVASVRSSRVWLWRVVYVAICVALIFVAVHALLMKLTIMYFAAMFSPYSQWHWNEYIVFFGFVNQLSGLSLTAEMEMVRILLFKFGGKSSVWTPDAVQACDTYFQLLAWETFNQLGRCRGLMVLYTFDAERMQCLLQSAKRDCQNNEAADDILSLMLNLDDKNKLVAARRDMMASFENTADTWQSTLHEVPEADRLRAFNTMWDRALAKLRTAIIAQDLICAQDRMDLFAGGSMTKSGTAKDENQIKAVLSESRCHLYTPSRIEGEDDEGKSYPDPEVLKPRAGTRQKMPAKEERSSLVDQAVLDFYLDTRIKLGVERTLDPAADEGLDALQRWLSQLEEV